MKFPEGLAMLSVDVKQWVGDNIALIRIGMESAHQERILLDAVIYDEVGKCFWPNRRTYSEMPICNHVWNRITPPPGFKVVCWQEGKVCIVNRSARLVADSCNHVYAQGPNDSILCLTPGLFEAYSENDFLPPGERLARFKRRAPELITLYPDGKGRMGIGVLFGQRREIAVRLGLIYTRNHNFPQ